MYVQFNFWLRFNVCDRTTTLISRWDESIIMLSCVVLCYVIWLIVRKFAQKSQNLVLDQHKNWILNNSIQTIEWNTNMQVKFNCETIITQRGKMTFSHAVAVPITWSWISTTVTLFITKQPTNPNIRLWVLWVSENFTREVLSLICATIHLCVCLFTGVHVSFLCACLRALV